MYSPQPSHIHTHTHTPQPTVAHHSHTLPTFPSHPYISFQISPSYSAFLSLQSRFEHSCSCSASPLSQLSSTTFLSPFAFSMASAPIIHDREEELIDPCDFLPPSFFIDSVYLNNSSNSFVEPPSEAVTPSSTAPSSPITPPEKANPTHKRKFLSNPLTSRHHHLSPTTPTRSSSLDNSSTPQQPILSNHDRRSSPIAIANIPDRPRQHDSNRRLISDKVSRFTRTTSPSSPDQVSATSPESVMYYPPNTTRLMRVVTNTHFHTLGAKRALKRKE